MAKSQQIETTVIDPQVNELPESSMKALLEKHDYPQGGQWTPKVVELLLELGDRLQNREFIIEKVSELASPRLRSRHLHAILSHAQDSTLQLTPQQRAIVNSIDGITINLSPPTEKEGGETTVEREKMERERESILRLLTMRVLEREVMLPEATKLWREHGFSTKSSYPELVKHWDEFFKGQKAFIEQAKVAKDEIASLKDKSKSDFTKLAIDAAKARKNEAQGSIVPKEIVDLWRTEFKNPARKAWVADRVKVLVEEASDIFRIFREHASSSILGDRMNSLNLLKVLSGLEEENWALTDELTSHEKQARRLAFKKFRELYYEKVDEFHSSEELEDVLTRNLIRMDVLTDKLKGDKSQAHRRVFLERYARAYRAMRNARDTLAVTEAEGDLDLTELNDKLNETQVDEFAQALVDWLKVNMVKNHKTYQALRSFDLRFVTGGHEEIMVQFKEGTQGRMATGASVIDDIFEREWKKDGLLESCVAWKFDRTNLQDKDHKAVWQAIETIAKQERMIPIANNGSRMLIRMYDEKGELSPASQFLDALFENFSQVGAYGLSILSASPVSEIGGEHNTPINSKWDEGGRDCKIVLYDAKEVEWLPGVDGAALNNMNVKAQKRCFSLSQAKQELVGAFFKGLTASARMTLLNDGGKESLWSVKDLINLAELNSEQFCQEFEYEDDTQENREEVSQLYGHFTCHPDADEFEKWQARNRAWDEWFDSNKNLPYVFGLEVGQLKGRGKMHLATMMPELQDVKYTVKVDGKRVEKTTGPKTGVKDLLKAHGGWFEISTDVYGWSIIDCPENSSTSLNYQPMSLLIYSEETLKVLQEVYQESTNTMIDTFSGEAFKARSGDDYDKLIGLISKVVGVEKANQLGEWATCLLKNPLSRLSRWATNFDRTHQKTLRLLMADHGEYRFTGLSIVGDGYVRKGKERRSKRAAQWRGPLLVESALQANWCISGELAAQLLDAWQAKEKGEQIDADLDKQLETIIKRLAFKRGDTESKIKKLLAGILRCIMDDAALVKLGEELVIMDVTDVENMQGDDDGDTVVLDFDEKIVQLFAETEIFWDKFKKANGFRTLQIEIDKDLKIDTAKANCIYSGKAYGDLCDQGKSLIDTFGIEVPEIAKHYGLDDKIPSPLGLNFKLADQIEKETKGGFFRNLAEFAFKTGSTPTGPIGAFSNVAPDLAIRALNQMDSDYVLNPYGKRLWQGYATTGSGVQISIDWAKGKYDIINLFYYDQKKEDGSWAIDFEQQLTPENVSEFLVKNTFKQGVIARFEFRIPENVNGKQRWVKDGHKMVRFKIVEKDDLHNLNPLDYIVNLDTTKIYEISRANLEALANAVNESPLHGESNAGGYQVSKVNLTEVNLMDAGNACFDFDSVYAIGSFIIQPPIEVGYIPGVFQENAAVWKTDLPKLLGKKRGDALQALNKSYKNSALVAHLTRFMSYTSGKDSKIKEIVGLMPLATKFALEDPKGTHLDELFDRIVVEVASFFDANGASDRGELNKAGVIRAIAKGFGLSMEELEKLYIDPENFVDVRIRAKKYRVDLVSIVSCLMRKDTKYLDEDVPQCMTQMILSDFLEKTEENPFTMHADEGRDYFINELLSIFGHDFVDKNNQKSIRCFRKQPNSFFDSKHKGKEIDGILGEYKDEFVNTYMEEVPYQNGEGFALHWKDDSNFWSAIRFFAERQKMRLCSCSHLWGGFQEIFIREAHKEGADLLQLQKQLFSAVRNIMSDFDSLIRTFTSYSEMKVHPEQIIAYNRSKDGVIAQKVIQGLDRSVYSYGNYTGQQVSTAPAFKLWVLSNGRMRLPEAQHNRDTQFAIVSSLINKGFIVKSWSYFGDARWRSLQEFGLIEKFARGKVYFGPNGEHSEGECPTNLWYNNVTLFSMNGAGVNVFKKLNTENIDVYKGALEHFGSVKVGRLSYCFLNPHSRVVNLMQQENQIVQTINWLRSEGSKDRYGNFAAPPFDWLIPVRGGKALLYKGKDYFNKDSLIATLSKSLRWS